MAEYLPVSLLHSLERRARDVLPRWNLPALAPLLVKYRENAVFRVARSNGSFAGLRLHRPGYHDETALHSELLWMKMLHAAGLSIPEPIETGDGHLLVQLEPVEGEAVQFADLLTWLPGSPLGESGRVLERSVTEQTALFQAIGSTMARMHTVSDGWEKPRNFRRPIWDRDGLLGEMPVWGRFWDCPSLTTPQKDALSNLRCRLLDAMTLLEKSQLDYGLIHADLVRENILVDNGQVSFIDFDDAGYGYRMFDIATALLKNRAEKHYDQILVALVSGYRKVRPLSERELSTLPLFLTLRSLTYIGWIASRPEMPGSDARLARYVAETLELANQCGGDGHDLANRLQERPVA